jgi:hypothetical protein
LRTRPSGSARLSSSKILHGGQLANDLPEASRVP